MAFLPLIAHLTGRRIIAADVPGDAGVSVPHRTAGGIDDLPDWLAELIGAPASWMR